MIRLTVSSFPITPAMSNGPADPLRLASATRNGQRNSPFFISSSAILALDTSSTLSRVHSFSGMFSSMVAMISKVC